MAQNATVFKAALQIADMDRDYYADHQLTLARHPSETDIRLMIRLLAFAMFAHEDLEFGKGLCADDEAELWQKDLQGDILLWISLGEPDEKQLRKMCNRARQVVIFNYDTNSSNVWWSKIENKLHPLHNLSVISISTEDAQQLSQLARRGMRLQFSIQDGQLLVTDAENSMQIEPVFRKRAAD